MGERISETDRSSVLSDTSDESGKARLETPCPQCNATVSLWYVNHGWSAPEPDDDLWCENCGTYFKGRDITDIDDHRSSS